ncbi:restriction endonuclease [Variovorax beijingensis]|uniref:Restriction endonuclease n=1 Tax=Variovorax beijingensis TaxID=2496117 RepID=A0ABY0A7W3_9BURK|nr:restriction endonuclease [Variovorax beijingensis]RSZ38612.1 restriction endonuclease [Variovorax beijingensis]
MSRRKKTSPAEDVVDLIALLPWYVGVILALAGYLLLHRIAIAPLPSALGPGALGNAMVGTMGRGLATAGQYIVPIFCLAGAAISAWRRHARRSLMDNVARSDGPDILDDMSWREFEILVGEGFRLQGYQVAENFEAGPDDGIDLTLRKNGEKYLVQCKQWRAFKVGVPVVRELYGVMAAEGAAGGFVVTSGRFTPEAEAFASGRNLRLLDGPQLHRLLKQARGSSSAKPAADIRATEQASNAAPQAAKTAAPSCPRCAQPMVRRTARKGVNAGQEFWGCSSYPRCRGTA